VKLLVLGATGRTGSQLVTQALAAGHKVRALVRNPQKLEADSSKIEVVVGDATDTVAVGEALEGVDAVLVALGGGSDLKSDLASRVARTFVPAMRDAGVGRVIVLSAFGAGETLPMASRLDRLLNRTLLKRLFGDKAEADSVWRSSGLDWTLVYAVTLTKGPRTGDYAATETLRARGKPTISRADVAEFMLAQVSSTTWSRRTAILSRRRQASADRAFLG
jgi:putative NADH-flavin reductase